MISPTSGWWPWSRRFRSHSRVSCAGGRPSGPGQFLPRMVASYSVLLDRPTSWSLKKLCGLGNEAAKVSGTQGSAYGFRDFYSDREQRVDDVGQRSAIYAGV